MFPVQARGILSEEDPLPLRHANSKPEIKFTCPYVRLAKGKYGACITQGQLAVAGEGARCVRPPSSPRGRGILEVAAAPDVAPADLLHFPPMLALHLVFTLYAFPFLAPCFSICFYFGVAMMRCALQYFSYALPLVCLRRQRKRKQRNEHKHEHKYEHGTQTIRQVKQCYNFNGIPRKHSP